MGLFFFWGIRRSVMPKRHFQRPGLLPTPFLGDSTWRDEGATRPRWASVSPPAAGTGVTAHQPTRAAWAKGRCPEQHLPPAWPGSHHCALSAMCDAEGGRTRAAAPAPRASGRERGRGRLLLRGLQTPLPNPVLCTRPPPGAGDSTSLLQGRHATAKGCRQDANHSRGEGALPTHEAGRDQDRRGLARMRRSQKPRHGWRGQRMGQPRGDGAAVPPRAEVCARPGVPLVGASPREVQATSAQHGSPRPPRSSWRVDRRHAVHPLRSVTRPRERAKLRHSLRHGRTLNTVLSGRSRTRTATRHAHQGRWCRGLGSGAGATRGAGRHPGGLETLRHGPRRWWHTPEVPWNPPTRPAPWEWGPRSACCQHGWRMGVTPRQGA